MPDIRQEEATLVGGPQDGAKVSTVGGVLPDPIFVGPTWQGDGYAAWGRRSSDRFPVRYDWDGAAYRLARRSG